MTFVLEKSGQRGTLTLMAYIERPFHHQSVVAVQQGEQRFHVREHCEFEVQRNSILTIQNQIAIFLNNDVT